MGLGAAGRRGRRGGAFRDINVTPLVDVMLVLLVVFMVTAPLMTTGVPIELPKANAANTPVEDAALVLTITDDERVFLGETEITDDVAAGLRADKRLQAKRELYVSADTKVPYGAVARAMAAAREEGVVALSLLVEPTSGAAAAPGQADEPRAHSPKAAPAEGAGPLRP